MEFERVFILRDIDGDSEPMGTPRRTETLFDSGRLEIACCSGLERWSI
jgi:hypothetical protein